jgi:adenylate cyclase
MKSTALFIFLFWMMIMPRLHATVSQSATDSLLGILRSDPQRDDVMLEMISQLNDQLFSEPELTQRQIAEILQVASQSASPAHIARLHLLSGISFDLQGMYDPAFVAYENGIALAEKNSLKSIEGELYNNYSISLAVLGRMEESISFGLKAREIFEALADSSQLSRVYNNLGSRYAEIRFIDNALDYYMMAAAINEKRNDFRRLAYNYGNIGLLLHGERQYEKALGYFYRSLGLLDTNQNIYDHSIALHNLALAYTGLKNFEAAFAYETRALGMARQLNDELGIVSALNGMAQIYVGKGEPRQALEFYNESENIALRLGARSYLMNIYEGKAAIFAIINDFRNAFEYNQKYLALKDSVMTIERDKAVQMLKETENERKQQEIQILTKDAEIQKLSIRRQKIIRNSVAAIGLLILIIAIGLLNRYLFVRKTRNELAEKNQIINHEKKRSDDLLLNILPAETAEELKNTGTSVARQFEMVTVMFTDFKGFTQIAEILTAQDLVNEINHCFKAFDRIIAKYNVEKIKTIGDAYMCAGGLPVANESNPEDVVRSAIEIQEFMQELKKQRQKENRPYFDLRIGVHTGPVIAGIVGIRKFQYDIWGDTVNIAARMESSGETAKVNVSATTYEKVKDRFLCTHRGKIEAKNKGFVDMYFVEAPK